MLGWLDFTYTFVPSLTAWVGASALVGGSCTCTERPVDDEIRSDECREYYEAGEWLKDIYFARGDWAIGTPPGFSCEE